MAIQDKKQLLDQGVWPNERQVLERPHRLRYVRKLEKPNGCVFCEALKHPLGPESLVLMKTKRLMVILNKYPYNNGHLLILPRKHVGDFAKLPSQTASEMSLLMQKCIQILEKVYRPHGFNTGMNLGSVAGAGIPEHVHMHVLPRWGGDTNFLPLIAETKLVVETNEQSYNLLRPHFLKLEAKGVF